MSTSPPPPAQSFLTLLETDPDVSVPHLLGMLNSIIKMLQNIHQYQKAHGGVTTESIKVSSGNNVILIGHFNSCSTDDLLPLNPCSPPEAYENPPLPPSKEADIYSFAAFLYHALNGHPPPPPAVRRSREKAPIPFSNPAVTEVEKEALLQALSLDPAARPASIAEFVTLLRRPPAISALGRPAQPPPQDPQNPALEPQPPAEPARPDAPPEPPKPAARPEPPLAPKTCDRLPVNLTRGQPCKILLKDIFTEGARRGWEPTFQNLEDLGLRLEESGERLLGTPTVDGEHLIQLTLHHPDAPSDRPKLSRSIKVTINPDPVSIWKNLPSDKKDPFWKPDIDKLTLPTPAAHILAASVRGRSHAQEGLFRDDDFSATYHKTTGWHFLIVADGAGSAKVSRRGSQLACQHAAEHLQEQLSPPAKGQENTTAKLAANDNITEDQARKLAYTWLGGAAHAALKAITDEAAAQDPPRVVKDYATTFLLSAARRTAKGAWIILSFGIGDGGICLRLRDGSIKVMSTPDSGAFSSETIFLTSKNLWMTTEGITQRLHAALVPDFQALVLMTDGITDPMFPTEVSLGDKTVWDPHWEQLTSAVDLDPANKNADEQLLKWAGFYSRGNHDDRTLMLMLPPPPKPRRKWL